MRSCPPPPPPPLLRSLLETFQLSGQAARQRAVFACCLAGRAAGGAAGLAYLWDHQVSGRAIFPGKEGCRGLHCCFQSG